MTTDRLAQYRRLVDRLAAAAERRDADTAAAHEAYAAGLTRAREELAAATAAAERAERQTAAAASALVTVDEEAHQLWVQLRRTLGWRGATLGDTPEPTEAEAGTDADELLSRAAREVVGLRRDGPRPTLPWPALPLLPLLGAAAATVVALLAGGLVALGQGDAAVQAPLRLLGYLAFLIAPFAGLPVAVAVADSRFAARVDPGGVGLVVLGGMVAACGISLALR
ncbi:MAG TPA: hypothetical protein VES42_01555 [Pilimelia sp.]|nr:hypothetical protein [Pilimelia sp.]